MGAVLIRNAKPRKGKIKKPKRGKNIKRKQISGWRGDRENGGGGCEKGVNKKGHPWAFMGRVKAFPGRKGGELAVPYRGILQGNDHRRGGEGGKATHAGKEHIPAPKAVMLYDGEGKKDPASWWRGRRESAILH